MTEDEINQWLAANSDLMDDLSKLEALEELTNICVMNPNGSVSCKTALSLIHQIYDLKREVNRLRDEGAAK